MNLSDLAARIAERHDLQGPRAKTIIADVFAEILDAAKRDEDTALTGFGKFVVKHRPPRVGRNPITGEPLQIAASAKLVFTAAKAAKDSLNNR